MFLFWFHPWPYILNVTLFRKNLANILSITVHVLGNLIWKICSLFGQIWIMCLKCSRAFFGFPLITKRCAANCYVPKMGLVCKSPWAIRQNLSLLHSIFNYQKYHTFNFKISKSWGQVSWFSYMKAPPLDFIVLYVSWKSTKMFRSFIWNWGSCIILYWGIYVS